ncbi:arginine/serine-rich coiled-coil protein 2 isoform X2 [Patella vulgata]|uniref:arginine/serine-rich coiled-coil protein 2 isoform X2 n=1 Tax=Patella vulgata TaxID=6465 RepID=UPI00217F8A25|nr:arginine/serine-rich coiled-coil protein 2 isoform X2 [Patella vulgata]
MDLLANYSDENSKQSPNPVAPIINKMDSKMKAKSLEEEWASFEKLIDGEKMSDTAEKNGAGTSDGNVTKRKFSEGASGTSESYAFEIQSSSSSCSSSRSNSVEPEKLPESKNTGDMESASHLPSQFRPRKDSGRGSSTSRSRSRSHSPRRSKKSKDKRSRSHSRDKRSRSRDRHRDRKSHKKEKRRHRSSSRDRKSRSHSKKRSSSRHRSPHSKHSRSRSKDRKRTRDRKSSRDRHRHRSKDRSHRRRKHSSKSPRRKSSRSPRRRSSRSPRRNSRSPRRHKSRSPRRRSSRSRSYSPRTFKNVPVDSYQKKLMGTLAKSSKPLTFREKMRQDLLKASKMLSDQADKGLLMDDTGKDKFRNLSSSSSTEASNVTPQMALLQTMAAMHQKAQEMTGVTVPKYYNPAAVNPLKYAEQFQKRKLLWSKNKEKKEEKGGEHWQGTAFQADNDGKISAKFRKLMGMKEDDPITDEALTEEQKLKREEIFNRLDKDYEFARMSTHTHRGVGLGFASQGMSIPQFPQP